MVPAEAAPAVAPSVAAAVAPRARIRLDGLDLGRALLWIGVTCLLANTIQVLVDGARAGVLRREVAGAALLAVAVVVALQGIARGWAWLREAASLRFAIAVLLALTAATMMGTLVLQTSNQAVFFGRYGALAPVLTWLHLHDLFHSAWFCWLLLLFGVGAVASVVQHRAWRLRQLGFLLSHGGLLLLLSGGAVGLLWGARGMVHLQIGETAAKYLRDDGRSAPLPFALTLDQFAAARREPRFRLYVVRPGGDGLTVAASFDAEVPGVHPVAGYGRVEVVAFQPAAQSPAVQLRLRPTAGAAQPVTLRAAGPASVTLGGDGPELRLAKKADDVENFVSTLGVGVDGRRAVTGEVRVNQPLSYRGYSFFQANYDPKNPRYSGILVVRDPGLLLVYAGLLASLLGIVRVLLLRPRRLKRRPA